MADDDTAAPTPTEGYGYPATDEDDPPGHWGMSGDGGATRFLGRLTTASPFLDLDARAGGDHPLRRGVCFFFDFVLRLTIWIAILAIVVAVAWKALAPLPDPFLAD